MKRMSYLRKDKGLSQAELSKILGISQQAVSKYENGTREPDNKTLISIASYFGVTTDYLLGTSDIKKPYDNDPNLLPEEFTNPTDAMAFILKQPSIMAYGGYSLDDMTDEEVLDFANDILIAIKITLEQKKKR